MADSPCHGHSPCAASLRSCLKTKSPAGRKYLGREPGGIFYDSSREAAEGMSKILYCKLQRARQLRDYEMQKVAERVTAMAQADRPTMTGRGGQGVQVAAVHFSEPLSRRFYVYDPERSLVEPVGYAIYTREEWAAVCSLPSDEIKREDWGEDISSEFASSRKTVGF